MSERATDTNLLKRIVLVVVFPLALVCYAISGLGRGIGECIEDTIEHWEGR